MRVAVFVENALASGGAFQQTASMIRAMSTVEGHDIVVLTPHRANMASLKRHGIEAHFYSDNGFARWFETASALSPRVELLLRRVRRAGRHFLGRSLDHRLKQLGVGLAFFNARSATALRLQEHPYVFTVWDLCHRDHPEFPEVSHGREFERREQVLRAALPKAAAVIVDSAIGGEKVCTWYDVAPDKVTVIPPLPSPLTRSYAAGNRPVTPQMVRLKYQLPGDYLFYPAQLWPHKNHIYLFEALVRLRQDHGLSPTLVLSGGDKGNGAFLREQARLLGVAEQVRFLGFVDDQEIPALYDGASALVMPTYFGPTNLPPVEAALIGCPVIYSDQPSFRQQMGDAALYCDLNSPGHMASLLRDLLTDAELREKLRANGRTLSRQFSEEDYSYQLQVLFDSQSYKRHRWTSLTAPS